MSTIEKSDKIYVAGHRGLVGSAIVRNLQAKGYENVIGRTHRELDLTSQEQVRDFLKRKGRMWWSWPLRRWAESMPTIPRLRNLPMKICRFSAMSLNAAMIFM